MAKKKYLYTVYVESYGEQETFVNVEADNESEAKENAKKLFIKQYWRKSSLKATIEDASINE
jgi:hypothetical protein